MKRNLGLWLIVKGMEIYGVADFWELVSVDIIGCGHNINGKCQLNPKSDINKGGHDG